MFTNLGFDIGVYGPDEGDVCDHNDWERAHQEKSRVLHQCGKPAVTTLVISFAEQRILTHLCDFHRKVFISKLGA